MNQPSQLPEYDLHLTLTGYCHDLDFKKSRKQEDDIEKSILTGEIRRMKKTPLRWINQYLVKTIVTFDLTFELHVLHTFQTFSPKPILAPVNVIPESYTPNVTDTADWKPVRLKYTGGCWWGVRNPKSQLIFSSNPRSQLTHFCQSQSHFWQSQLITD